MNEIDKYYLGGFFDADGCIQIEKQNQGFCLRIKFSQSNLEWCNWLLKYYPELHLEQDNRKTRVNFELRIGGKKMIPLLDTLLETSILKYPQLVKAKEFLSLIGIPGKSGEREEYYNVLRQLKLREHFGKVEDKPFERLNKYYIAGVFDGDGCIHVSKKNQSVLSFSQKSRHILDKIKEYYNLNTSVSHYKKTDVYKLTVCSKQFICVLKDLLETCKYKFPQLKQVFDTCNETGKVNDSMYQTMKDLKTIDITDKDSLTLNTLVTKKEHGDYIIQCIDYILENFSYTEILHNIKQKQIVIPRKVKNKDMKIYNPEKVEEWKVLRIDPELIFCETRADLDLYTYYRNNVSSLPFSQGRGRQVKILVRDRITSQYLGIMCLSSDVYDNKIRDTYLNWSKTDKKMDLSNLYNISCCVPLQPFGYNTAGGKLLAMLAFSKEVSSYIESKYKSPPVYMITTSIHGKSIQYKDLDCLEYIGKTKGIGTLHIPDELYDEMNNYDCKWLKSSGKKKSKLIVIQRVLSDLKLSQDLLYHGQERGVYIGKVLPIQELKKISDIVYIWKTRYAIKRVSSLYDRNLLSKDLRLYDKEYYSKNPSKIISLPKYSKNLTDVVIMDILKYKKHKDTYDEISTIISNKYNIQVTKQDVFKIMTGKLKPSVITEEYEYLIEIMKQRKTSNRSLTDSQIYFIKDCLNKKQTFRQIEEQFSKLYTTVKLNSRLVSYINTGKLHPLL